MEILKNSRREVHVSFNRVFVNLDQSSGYSFPCDERGCVHPLDTPEAKANLALCLAGGTALDPILDKGVETTHHVHETPAEGRCAYCGRSVLLNWTENDCGCGAIYNAFGQLLAPREQWGEEFNFQDDY